MEGKKWNFLDRRSISIKICVPTSQSCCQIVGNVWVTGYQGRWNIHCLKFSFGTKGSPKRRQIPVWRIRNAIPSVLVSFFPRQKKKRRPHRHIIEFLKLQQSALEKIPLGLWLYIRSMDVRPWKFDRWPIIHKYARMIGILINYHHIFFPPVSLTNWQTKWDKIISSLKKKTSLILE